MITRGEALAAANAEGKALDALCRRACEVRDAHWGCMLTYSRKVFVPLTTMCRDTCGYCAFVKHPPHPEAWVMSPEAVMDVVRRGHAAGCKEVLFSFGEKPERRYREARAALAALGFERMTDYAASMAGRVLEETGLLPHINAGTLDAGEIAMLKPVSGSMGMMLESVSMRLLKKGGPHHACPDKVPAARLATIEEAGRAGVPFTTGILIGIGETWEERIDSLQAIAELHERHGHVQEVIVQNFQAKPGIAMAEHPEPSLYDMLRTLAVARLLLPADISLQAPPNLEARHSAYIGAGLNDWGGISPVTIDHINPQHAWPQIDALKSTCAAAGFKLQERLTVYPAHLAGDGGNLAPAVARKVMALARRDGLAAVQA